MISAIFLTDVLVNGDSAVIETLAKDKAFQMWGKTTAGAGTATITIYGSVDGTRWVEVGHVDLVLGVGEVNDGFQSDASWRYHKATVSNITGTGAKVSCQMGF